MNAYSNKQSPKLSAAYGYWWRLSKYGFAEPVRETPALIDRINSGEPGWYGNVEGMIFDGVIEATAFERKIEKTYDTEAWLKQKQWIPTGTVMTTKITAAPGLDPLTRPEVRTIYNP